MPMPADAVKTSQIPIDAVERAAELLERRVKKPALDGRLIVRLAKAGERKAPLQRVRARTAAGRAVLRRAEAVQAKGRQTRERLAGLDLPGEFSDDARLEQKISQRDLTDRLSEQADEVIARSKELIAEKREGLEQKRKEQEAARPNGKPRRRQWMRI